jgi:hypothetical protein
MALQLKGAMFESLTLISKQLSLTHPLLDFATRHTLYLPALVYIFTGLSSLPSLKVPSPKFQERFTMLSPAINPACSALN